MFVRHIADVYVKNNITVFLSVFLRAQVPEGQHGNAHYDHEHLGASKSKPADPVLL